MRYLTGSACLLGIALALIVSAGSANAQATRTWVSGVGDDANPCSRTAPCKTFPGAISKTAAGGEINVLDPGGFGAVTITKSITIRSDHVEAGVLVSGTNGIIISVAATDRVVLEGLDIEGLGTGLNGVQVIGSGNIFIRNCSIRHFTGNGVNVVGTANARVVIADSQILYNNGGVNVQGAGGAANSAGLLRTIVDSNTSFAVQATGAANSLGLSASFLAGSPAAISNVSGATILSLGANNVLLGTGAFTTTNPLK